MRLKRPVAILLCLFWGGVSTASGQQDAAKKREADYQAIQARIQSYVVAFNKKDVDGLVSHWSQNGAYTNHSDGEQVLGRQAIAKQLKSVFAAEQVPKLAVQTESIEFISPNVALERGFATVTLGENDPVETRYRVVFVKKDDAWLIDRVTEEELEFETSNYENLKTLDWLIGEWVDEADGYRIEMTASWTKNQNFIARRYQAFQDDEFESSGLQVIGWDANEEKIRSWLFDSSGGVIQGTWNQRDDRWVVQSVATLSDGSKGSFTSIFRPQDDGNYIWQKINQVIDGKILPNVKETIVQRK